MEVLPNEWFIVILAGSVTVVAGDVVLSETLYTFPIIFPETNGLMPFSNFENTFHFCLR